MKYLMLLLLIIPNTISAHEQVFSWLPNNISDNVTRYDICYGALFHCDNVAWSGLPDEAEDGRLYATVTLPDVPTTVSIRAVNTAGSSALGRLVGVMGGDGQSIKRTGMVFVK